MTKSERRFVYDQSSVSRSYGIVLKNRINKKIQRCASDLQLIQEKNSKLQLNLGIIEELFDTGEPLQKSVISGKKGQDEKKDMKTSILDMNKMA
ncbi:MAG: hypothetical protein ACREA7_05230 [Nitrosotalea sp.]